MKHRDYVDERAARDPAFREALAGRKAAREDSVDEERCAVCDDGDTDYVCDQCAELPPDYDGRHRPQDWASETAD